MKSSLHFRCYEAVQMWHFLKVVLCEANWNPEETKHASLMFDYDVHFFFVNCWDVFALLGNS